MSAIRTYLAQLVRRDLRAAAATIDEHALRHRIDDYYLPVFRWTEALVTAKQTSRAAPAISLQSPATATTPSSQCVVIGLSCVQGGGKTTLVKYLEALLEHSGKRCATLSLDDVYLTRADQVALASAHPGNRLLEFRGNPGTHDLSLLLDVVHNCKTTSTTANLLLPRYDKSLYSGRGDRAPQSEWITKRGPLDVLLIEGWCMGFEALDATSDAAALLPDDLQPINEALRSFNALYAQLDGLITIQAGDVDWVYKWREEQEQQLRAADKPALSPTQVRDFVDRFMPTYATYLPSLYARAAAATTTVLHSDTEAKNDAYEQLVVEIDAHRNAVSITASERLQSVLS